jgi:hypothetical protein
MDTGFRVTEHERVYISATGTVFWSERARTTGPDGLIGSWPPGFTVGSGGLVGRISGSSKVFRIGARTQPYKYRNPKTVETHPAPPLKMPATGTLVLGFRDFTAGANTGLFEVTIRTVQ